MALSFGQKLERIVLEMMSSSNTQFKRSHQIIIIIIIIITFFLSFLLTYLIIYLLNYLLIGIEFSLRGSSSNTNTDKKQDLCNLCK